MCPPATVALSGTAAAAERRSARERLLDAADELFYEHGVNTVGIDRVIERAGVAKASLYATFGSKDELIRAYLQRRHERRRALIDEAFARCEQPRERLLAIFDVLGELVARRGTRGCAFVNAGSEAPPGGAIEQATDAYRAWVRELFCENAEAAGAADPDTLADQLTLLYHGAAVCARMDHGSAGVAAAARTAAASLVEDALARPRPRPRRQSRTGA
jgi:AcrR family transcriptional regulator